MMQTISGVRHRCLSCPDFDYCSACIVNAGEQHTGHRFVPIYAPLPFVRSARQFHRGIYCDGLLCTNHKGYIIGDRYKCAVCDDTDFCAKCEALPTNGHNASHPLIKFRVPIRHVSVTTSHETDNCQEVVQLGDRPMSKHVATETNRPTSANAATQVQTVAEVKPAENIPAPVEALPGKAGLHDLQAWYVSDLTPDGTRVGPNHHVTQSWTLRNPGPTAWPAGCAVYYIGGDDMRNLDARHPSSVSAMASANRSNVLETGLEPGKTTVFTVLVKSPNREGRAISYWRLKTPSGLPFGHKLWVDLEVYTTPVELPIRSAGVAPISIKTEQDMEGAEDDKSPSSSVMIFPKLEKESPASSVHNVVEAHVEVPAPLMEPTTKTDEQEMLEDVESLELEESETDEDGFLTDEEYDILDASDEDFLEAQQAASK